MHELTINQEMSYNFLINHIFKSTCVNPPFQNQPPQTNYTHKLTFILTVAFFSKKWCALAPHKYAASCIFHLYASNAVCISSSKCLSMVPWSGTMPLATHHGRRYRWTTARQHVDSSSLWHHCSRHPCGRARDHYSISMSMLLN